MVQVVPSLIEKCNMYLGRDRTGIFIPEKISFYCYKFPGDGYITSIYQEKLYPRQGILVSLIREKYGILLFLVSR